MKMGCPFGCGSGCSERSKSARSIARANTGLAHETRSNSSARLTSSIALVISISRGQASVQLKIVRQRQTPDRVLRIRSRSAASLIAAVEDEPVSIDDRRWTDELGIRPGDRAGGGAGRAEDALGRVLEAFAFLRDFAALTGARSFVGDQVRLDRFVGIEELVHIDDQILDRREADQRLDRDLLAELVHQHFAGEPIAAVDPHGVGAADAVGAGAAVGERAILVPLDPVEGIEHPVGRLDVEQLLLEGRLDVDVRVVSLDPKGDLHRWCSPPG